MKILYPLKIDDAGCHLSLRPEERSDCTVRAFSIVTNLPYNHIYDVLREAGRRPHQGFDSDKWLARKKGRVFGGVFKPVNVKGLTPLTVGNKYPVGRYIIETPDHVYGLLDGVSHDLVRLKDNTQLTGAWKWFPPS